MTKQKSNINSIFLAAQNWLLFFIILAGSLYITALVMTSFFGDVEKLIGFSTELKEMSIQIFGVLKPFIELVIVIWLTEFVLRKLNISISKGFSSVTWKPKTMIILSLLFAFIIAMLVVTSAAVYLKGLILVFLGVYLGANLDAVKKIFKVVNTENQQHVNIKNN